MTPTEVSEAHFRTFNSSWDYTTDPEHTIADISITKVKKFISLVNRGRKNKIKDAPLKALEKLDLVRGKRISRACYLLFLKRESLFTAVELGRFQTPTLIKDGDRTKADLFTQVDAVFNFILKHLNKEYIITGKPQRDERWDYPLDALREIIINSIVHRDYSGLTGGVVKVFDDKIQIFNSGKLPHGLTVPMLLRGDYPSTPRNTQIAEMFKEAGVIERYGSGISRIITDFKEYGLAAPEFAEVGNSFLVTVYKERISGLVQIPGKGLVEKVPKKVTVKVPEKTKGETKGETEGETKGKTLGKILAAIKANPAVTVQELMKLLGLSDSGVEWNLRKLKAAGLLKRVGSTKGGHWEVLSQ